MIDRRATLGDMLVSAAANQARMASPALRSEMDTTSVRLPSYSSVRRVSPLRSAAAKLGKRSPGFGAASAMVTTSEIAAIHAPFRAPACHVDMPVSRSNRQANLPRAECRQTRSCRVMQEGMDAKSLLFLVLLVAVLVAWKMLVR